MSRRAWVLFAALSLVWGVPYFFVKIALHDLAPAWIAFGRVALGALVLVPLISRADWVALRGRAAAIAVVALTDIALPFYLIANGERSVSSSFTGLLLAAIPLVVTLLTLAFDRHERLTAAQFAGLLVGIAGVAALMGVNLGHPGAEKTGIALILGATLSYSVGVIMIKRWLYDLPMLATAAAMLAAATVLLAPAAFLVPQRMPGAAALVSLGVLGGVCTAAAYVMYFALIAQAGAIRATVVTYLNPAVAAVLGVAVLHESISAGAVAGLLLVIVGSWLSTGGPPAPQVATRLPRPAQAPSLS